MRWSREDDEALDALLMTGMGPEGIAQILEHPVETVEKKIAARQAATAKAAPMAPPAAPAPTPAVRQRQRPTPKCRAPVVMAQPAPVTSAALISRHGARPSQAARPVAAFTPPAEPAAPYDPLRDPRQGWTPERLVLAERLYSKDGLSPVEIAEALGGGITRGQVAGKAFHKRWSKPSAEIRTQNAVRLGKTRSGRRPPDVKLSRQSATTSVRNAVTAAARREANPEGPKLPKLREAIVVGVTPKPLVDFDFRPAPGTNPMDRSAANERQDGECQWPLNRPDLGRGHETLFCCAPVATYVVKVDENDPGTVRRQYCEVHARLAWPASLQLKRKKPERDDVIRRGRTRTVFDRAAGGMH